MASLETNAAALRAAHLPRRPSFHALVVIPAVAVIVVMAIIVSNSAADALRESAKESAVQNVEAIVRGYLDPALGEASLDLDAARDPAIDQQLERLTQSGELRRISIWSRDGRIVYSSDPTLRGRRFSIGTELGGAYAGEGVARYIDAGVGGAPANNVEPGADPTLSRRYLELFVPIRGMVDGNPIGVYDVFQDAQRIEIPRRLDASCRVHPGADSRRACWAGSSCSRSVAHRACSRRRTAVSRSRRRPSGC